MINRSLGKYFDPSVLCLIPILLPLSKRTKLAAALMLDLSLSAFCSLPPLHLKLPAVCSLLWELAAPLKLLC